MVKMTAVLLVFARIYVEVPGLIPAHGEENFGVRTREYEIYAFSSVICRDDTI